MGDFKNLPINFILIGLFISCTLTFIIGMATNNDQPIEDFVPESIDVTGYEDAISDARDNAGSARDSVEEDIPQLDVGSVLFLSIKGIAQTFTNIILNIFNLIISMLVNILGIPRVAVNALITILLITIILGTWKLLKQGS